MDEELKRVIEAILFAAGKKVELEQIARLCRRSPDEILFVIRAWKLQLDEQKSPTMLVEDGTGWKLTIREEFIPVIKRVVTKTELPKSILETLAIVAYKAPVLQSKVVKLRTNKAYDHLNYIENLQLITREKSGRSKLIKLTPKFFEYFDIDPSQLRKKFGNARDVEKAIEQKEKEIEDNEAAQIKQTGENLGKAQIVMGGEPLETYNASVDLTAPSLPPGVEVAEDKVGELEVYQSEIEEKKPHKHHKKKEKELTEEIEDVKEEIKEEIVEKVETPEEIVEEKVEEVVEEKPKKKSHKEVEKVEVELKEESPKEEIKEEVKVEVDKFSQEAISEAAQKKAQKLKSKEGKGLFQKGVPPEVEAKIEERISKLMKGESDEDSEKTEEQEENKE
jgi:segregation and condensation protein B